MNSVESAASLFGSDDAGPDPFAVLGDDTETAATHPTDNAHGETLSSSDKLGTDAAAANLFDSGASASSTQYTSGLGPTSQDPYTYDAPTYSQNPSSSASYHGDQHAQGWYDEHGQWQTRQYLPTQSGETAQEYTTGQHQSLPSNPYDPYSSRANTIPTQSYAPEVSHTQPIYTPYQQPTSISTSNYNPSQVTTSPSQPAYNPYAPPAPGHQVAAEKSTSYPYANAGPTSYGTTPKITPTVPAPPAPSAAAYRPKTSNAYDPPLPPPKPSRRTVSAVRPARAVSPAVGQQTYPLYDASALPPPPSLPAKYAAYSAPHAAQSYGSHTPPGSGGVDNSAAGYRNANSWNNHSVDNRYMDGANGDYGMASSAHELTDSANMSSQYAAHSSTYESQTSPLKALGSGKTDETPTPRQLPNSTLTDNADLQHSQTQTQSAPPSRRSFDDSSYGQTRDWVDANMTRETPPTVDEDGFATSFPSAPLPSRGSGEYSFPGNATTNGQNRADSHDSLIAERAVSPAQMSSQSWSRSPRASPDLHRTRDSNVVSPPPSFTGYGSNSYDLTATGRTSSPGSEFRHSRNGSEGNVDPYAPMNQVASGTHRTSSPANMPNGASAYAPTTFTQPMRAYDLGAYTPSRAPPAGSDPYVPNFNAQPANVHDSNVTGTTSPPSSWQGPHSSAPDPYAPPLKSGTPYMPLETRGRSASTGSTCSVATTGQYAPPQQRVQQAYGASQFGNYTSAYHHPGPQEPSYGGLPHDSSAGQEISLAPPTHTPYAPSPSLMGLNDPLGRTSARIPVFSFGFGGKVVTYFHEASALSTGFDVALSSRQSTDIQIRVLHKVIPASALDSSTAIFPGPLFSDPGSPTNSLVRTTASQVKAKKASVSKYLDERADEIHRGIAYLHPGSEDRRQADGKLVLVRLLKVMVENDGQLSGTPQIDTSVRAALLPRLAESGALKTPLTASSLSFSSPMPDSYSGFGLSTSDSGESPIAVSTLRPSALTKIQDFLLRGERRQAYHFALDGKLWAHAMVIASSIDKEAWKEVVNEFIRAELGVNDDGRRLPVLPKVTEPSSQVTNGREWLRVAYSLFSGQGPAAVRELLPLNQLSRTAGALQVPTAAVSHITPMSPNFPSPSVAANIPSESLSKWPETAAVMVSSPMVPDTSAALTALGDYLVSNGWVEAAHACYLLSPITSPIGGIGSPSTRLVLVGSRSPHRWPAFHKDPDPVIFSEIVEFAMSLTTPPKGQEPFHGLPHLQGYRLIRATSLAEMGQVDIAKRYCEAITSSLGRSSPYFTPTFMDQLRGLLDRLIGAPHLDKSGSWIGGKMSKPSLDSIGGWLEGRLTKFIAGDGDMSPVPTQESARGDEPGVFTHYSTISSATTSASPSPQPSHINQHTLHSAPPRRSGSAMATHSSASPYVQIDRASSAMEYSRPDARRASPGPRIASASASTTTFTQSPSFGQAVNGYGPVNGHISSYSNDTISPKSSLDTPDEEGSQPQAATWWGSYNEDSSAPTPTATTFLRVDESPVSPSSSGFISLMDDPSFSISPSPPASRREPSSTYEDDDEEDLGFGNSKKRDKVDGDDGSKKSSEPAHVAAPERPDIKPTQTPAASTSSGSWLGRFWKRAESTPGPIKASLGDETSFYYDKEQKRWVNKKAGTEEAAKPAAPPPPPSRSQTASPGRSNPMTSSSSSLAPPPARSASAIDLSVSPPSSKSSPRVRSNLVPPESQSSSITPAPGSALVPPPAPGRPKSSASKRNIRSRYVDILQDGGAK